MQPPASGHAGQPATSSPAAAPPAGPLQAAAIDPRANHRGPAGDDAAAGAAAGSGDPPGQAPGPRSGKNPATKGKMENKPSSKPAMPVPATKGKRSRGAAVKEEDEELQAQRKDRVGRSLHPTCVVNDRGSGRGSSRHLGEETGWHRGGGKVQCCNAHSHRS